MKLYCLLLSCLVLTSLSYSTNLVNLTNDTEPFHVKVMESDGNRTVLNYSIDRYGMDEVTIDGKKYTLMQKLRKESMIEEQGSPRLPRINRSLLIPDEGVMGFEIIDSDFIEITDIDIAPSKGRILRSTDPGTVPYTFSEVYRTDAFFPADLVHIRKPHILRDYRGVVVELNAFRYNPVTRVLRIYTDITIEVKKKASGGENILTRTEPLSKIDPQFCNIYRNHFVNFSELDYPTLLETGEMLVICYDDFMEEMEPLVEWKIQKGIATTIVPVSQVGNDWRDIKDYIYDTYWASNLTYVLLVGDAMQLNTVPEDSGSDPVYSLTSGQDEYPDLFIGRLSAETRAEIEIQVIRLVEYEKYPQIGADWYHKGLGAASDQGAGAGHYGEADNEHMTIIAYKLLDYTYTQVDSAYHPWGNSDRMRAILNEGRGILNYCGHGGPGGWGPPSFNNDDINVLVNENMLPFVINVACGTGDFVEYTCMGETWLRATHYITGEPTGGIGAYMSRTSMGWTPGMDMQDEAVDLLVADSMRTFGGLCYNGSMLMMDVGSGWGPFWEFKNLTIFGDPSLSLRSDTPFELEVTHNDELPVGESSFEVVVTGPGGPIKDAMVCGMNDNIYASAVTNASGQAVLEFDSPPIQAGMFTLTVSGGNAIPYIVEVDIIDPSGPYVTYIDHNIQDDITGNNNGQLDYAETVELGVTVENAGASNTVNVIGILHSDDPLVDITRNTASFGDIAVGSSASVDRAFAFDISPQVEDGDPVIFMLTTTDGINSWETNFSIISHAPDIVFQGLTINDTIGGNGNTNLDPGETADLTVTLTNIGSSDTDVLEVILASLDPVITVNSTTVDFAAIQAGSAAQGIFNVSVSPNSPSVHSAALNVSVSDILGFNDTTGFTTIISDLPFLPCGPDNYGYLAYDRYDVPLMPEYEWVELHPDSGGSGIWLPFQQLDQVYHERLPFPFQFYGITYDSLTIANKGYLCMGITDEVYYNHSAIPDTNGSGAMIAGYWYDLVPMWTGSGEVWQWHDEVNHCYIVEYNHIPRYGEPDSFETFEIILFDPAHYTTLTGDGQILFQYKEMSELSTQTGTIGIENRYETDGIQYQWNFFYDPHAHPIENETAILFTTPVTAPDIIITLTPAITPVIIPAAGGRFDYDLFIENAGSFTVIHDVWFDIDMPGGSVHGPVALFEDIPMQTGCIIRRTLHQSVPGNSPAGIYTYTGKIGNYPNLVLVSDSFPFDKHAGDGADSPYTDWTLTGWFEDEMETSGEIPESYFLSQNYPNPFNNQTTVSFNLPTAGNMSLKIYDITGREVAALATGHWALGQHSVIWDAEGMSSGIYFVRLMFDGQKSMVKKVVLVK